MSGWLAGIGAGCVPCERVVDERVVGAEIANNRHSIPAASNNAALHVELNGVVNVYIYFCIGGSERVEAKSRSRAECLWPVN